MTVRGSFLQSGSYSAEDFRQALSSLLNPENVASTLRPAGGVIDGYGTELAVVQNGTPNMSVNVGSGRCVVQGTTSVVQGAYSMLNDAVLNVAITAAHATLPRIDLIVARVQDASYAGAVNSFTIEVVTGVAAGSPAVPAAPASSFILAQIAVAAAVTSITNANITDRRTFTSTTPRPFIGGEAWITSNESIAAFGNRWLVWHASELSGGVTLSNNTVPALGGSVQNRINLPLAGYYRIHAQAAFDYPSAPGHLLIGVGIFLNQTGDLTWPTGILRKTFVPPSQEFTNNTAVETQLTRLFAAGDHVEIAALHNSAASVDVVPVRENTYCSVEYLGA